ncbi:hypothetical protein NRP93_000719 [Clostridium botulinum]|nr:hypothetical protein [Clostridium botulinum]
MEIIKKSGNIEKFDENKLKTSIANSTREIDDAYLTESDLNNVVKDVKSILGNIRKENEKTSSYEVIGIVNHVLKRVNPKEY